MLFLLFILITIISILLLKKCLPYGGSNGLELTAVIMATVGVTGFVICLFVLIGNMFIAPAEKLQKLEQYDGLMYKIENGIYQDDLRINDKGIINEISEWNRDVVYSQTLRDNFWVGVFIPRYVENLETIDYELIKKR